MIKGMDLIRSNHSRCITDDEKQEMLVNAEALYGRLLTVFGFDWRNDPNMRETPKRVVKAWVNELACGCYQAPPKITAFDNIDQYDGIVFSGDIKVVSLCAHHLLVFTGKAFIAYCPQRDGKVIGLSKLNRIVEYFSRRPQIQENLTMQIHDYVAEICTGNLGVAVCIEAEHSCVRCRGVQHDSIMKTAKLSGVFLDDKDQARQEFYNFVG